MLGRLLMIEEGEIQRAPAASVDYGGLVQLGATKIRRYGKRASVGKGASPDSA